MSKIKWFVILSAILFAAAGMSQEPTQESDSSKKEDTKKTEPQAKTPGGDQKEKKAEEPKMDVVVTASRFEKPAVEVAKSIEVKDRKKISSEGDKTLSEVLVNSPGMFVTQTGGFGGETGIYMRGAQTDQVLVMIDGIEANDPMSLGRSAQAELFTLPGVDRVEILQGPASALYGSDAEAGVINIITARPRGGPGANLYLEGGSFNTYQEMGEFYVGRPNYYADFSVEDFQTEGISTASSRLGNDERDGYKNLSFSLKGGGKPASWLELDLVGKAISSETELDTVNLVTGLPEDDPNYTTDGTQYYTGASAVVTTGDFKQTLAAQYAYHLRNYNDDPDDAHPNTSMNGDYESDLRKASWQGEFSPNLENKFVAGLEYQDESGESTIKGDGDYGPYVDEFPRTMLVTRSAFALWDFHTLQYGFMAGGRADSSDQFGNHPTGEFSGYLQPLKQGPKLRAGVGTGFKAPSLFQLYGFVGGFQVGNPGLKPEKSESWEAGLDQEFFDGDLKLGVTYFDVRYTDLIVWDNLVYAYNNVDSVRAPGWEASMVAKPLPTLAVSLGYTFVDARDAETHEKLIRRWGEKYSFGLDWKPVPKLELYLWGIYRGATEDELFQMYEEKRVQLDPYTVVSADLKYQLQNNLALNLRAINIFDEQYYDVYGYGTMPQTFYAGVSYNLEGQAAKQ